MTTHTLKSLLSDFIDLTTDFDREISGLSIDSRSVIPGQVFIALPGKHTSGEHYIEAAIEAGAVAVLHEASSIQFSTIHHIPLIGIPDLIEHYGAVAARYYGDPSKDLTVIAVTGTNGKTSTTHFIAHILNELGANCALIGTLGLGNFSALQASKHTTPDALTLQKALYDLRSQGFTHVAMEVSSHALSQHRVDGIHFAAAVFTNLTQDHLDYHSTLENYAKAKKRLFTEWPLTSCVINAEDSVGESWLKEWKDKKNIWAFSTQVPPEFLDRKKTFYTENIQLTAQTIFATLQFPGGTSALTVNKMGLFNLSNALAALSTVCALGYPLDPIVSALTRLPVVPGRMQLFKPSEGPLIVVDYAHTPDALEKTLQALKAHRPKKLWCVFGCGGDRDRAKRPIMGVVAYREADEVIITDDNCRNELPEDIVADILKEVPEHAVVQVEHDRALAIKKALTGAGVNDIVLIAGKGHENYQDIKGVKHYFSDIDRVKSYL